MSFLGCSLALTALGCSAFNPAFLNLLSSSVGGGDSFITLPNPPGFVVLAMVNNAQVDEQLVSYLAPKLNMSDADKLALHPRIRMWLRITYADGTFQTVEMIDGSTTFVDPTFNAQSVPDLNRSSLTNVVARCDVASIALEPNTNIQVFIPVPLVAYQLVVTNLPVQTTAQFLPRGETPPQFRPLQLDDLDASGNVILRRNIGVVDVLSPTTNVVCGSILAISVGGALAVPFFRESQFGEPSYDQDDAATVAAIGGRFEFRVNVK